MKKAVITLIIVVTSISPGLARIYIDGFGTFTMAGDAKNHIGGGISLVLKMDKFFNIIARGAATLTSDRIEGISAGNLVNRETGYKYYMGLVGAEFSYPLPFKLKWNSALGIGISSINYDIDFDIYYPHPTLGIQVISNGKKMLDYGVYAALWTGISYALTQRISPFLEIGFHKSFFMGEARDENIFGLQAFIGVRITVWGKNRGLSDDL